VLGDLKALRCYVVLIDRRDASPETICFEPTFRVLITRIESLKILTPWASLITSEELFI